MKGQIKNLIYEGCPKKRRQVALFIKSKTQEDGTCAKQDSRYLHYNYALI